MNLLKVWDVDSIAIPTKKGKKKRISAHEFSKILSNMTEKKLKAHKEKPRILPHGFSYYDGLTPYTYLDKPCMILWDEASKIAIYQVPREDGSTESWQYALEYSFQDAKQVALCQYSDECYVLMLLTKGLEDMTQD